MEDTGVHEFLAPEDAGVHEYIPKLAKFMPYVPSQGDPGSNPRKVF